MAAAGTLLLPAAAASRDAAGPAAPARSALCELGFGAAGGGGGGGGDSDALEDEDGWVGVEAVLC